MKTEKEKTAEQLAREEENIEFELASELCPASHVTPNGEVIHVPARDGTPEIKRLRRMQAQINQEKLLLKKSYNNNVVRVVVSVPPCARRTQERRGAEGKKQAAAGDSPADPELPRSRLADESALAAHLCISKKTLQNIYSKTPHLLPPAIYVPGARGPRWTHAAIQEWLDQRPQHTSKTLPVAPHRKVGRPRIAVLRSNGGAR